MVGLGTPKVLHILYKYYGGIEWFNDKPFFLLVDCLKEGIEKELELPRIIQEIYEFINGKPQVNSINKKMRSAKEILKDYGLGGDSIG